jgi:hypothetical protein
VCIEIPFNAPANQPCKIWYQHGDETEEIQVEACRAMPSPRPSSTTAMFQNLAMVRLAPPYLLKGGLILPSFKDILKA